MKNLALLSIVGIVLALSSCIPSLHGIVTDETRLIDDQILGVWSQRETGLSSFQFEVTNDDLQEKREAEESLANFASGKGEIVTWNFERASNIKFESDDGKSSLNLGLGVPSMAPLDMLVTGRSLLPFYILTHQEKSLGDTVTTRLLVHLTEIGGKKYMDFKPYPLEARELEGRFASNYLYTHTFAKYDFRDDGLSIHPIDGEYVEELIKQKRVRLKHERLDEDEIVLTASTTELRAFLAKYGDDPSLFEEDEKLTSFEEK